MSKPAPDAVERPTLTAKEAAAALGISANSFYAHVRVGHIAVVRLGKKIIVRRDEVERILRQGIPSSAPAPAPASPLD